MFAKLEMQIYKEKSVIFNIKTKEIMGWGTDFLGKLLIKRRVMGLVFKTKVWVSVFLNKEIFHDKREIKNSIADRKQNVQNDMELLLMIAMANPKDLATDEEDVLYSTRNRVNDLIDDIIEEQYKITLEQLYLDAIEDGTAKLDNTNE